VDRDATLALARGARRLHVKLGDTLARLDGPFTGADLAKHLVHEDGFLRVPVLVMGDVIVRGYSEALYREALGSELRPQPPR
jgi:hypothetical protein